MRNGIITLALGLFILLGCAYAAQETSVSCAGVTMHPGDSCEHTTNGKTRTLSYDQQRSQDQFQYIAYMIGGGLIAAAGAGMMLKARIDGRRSTASSLVFIGRQADPIPAVQDQIHSGH